MTTQGLSRLGPVLPLALGFLVLIGISAVSVWLVDHTETDLSLVTHTLQVGDELSSIQILVRRAESEQRGYLLTGDARYRTAERAAVQAAVPLLEGLRRMTDDNPLQQAAVTRLQVAIQDKFAEMDEAIRLHDAGDTAGAVGLVRTDRSRMMMTRVREIFDEMRTEEDRLLMVRRADSRRTKNLLLTATLLGSILIIGLAALATTIVRRSARAQHRARETIAGANLGLEAAVAERTADLQDANEEIQRFAYIVSHDLRSPLVNIMGFTTELEALRDDIFKRLADLRRDASQAADPVNAVAVDAKDQELGQDFDEALGFIKTSIAKMDRLINAILRLSREGRRSFKPERIDMDALVRSIADIMAHQASAAGAEIVASDLPAVTSDRLALEQVFSNLVDNALKYSRKGVPGRIEIEGRAGPAGLVYEVRDNGRGIDPKDRERVFELFRRSGVQDRPGEGIGLAHVRALVRRLGGTIALASEPGRGSTFTITLPRRWIGERQRDAA